MKKIILTKGLPASGKTTWAKEFMSKETEKWKRINKDELRLMLDCGKWSKDNEKFILEIRDTIITFSMLQGFNIIIDDTNLAPKHEAKIREMINLHNTSLLPERPEQYELEIKDFTNVLVDECIKRDKDRQNAVGEKVIKTMYKQFLYKAPKPIEYASTLPFAIVFDIDGTLALFGDKNPYERDFINDLINHQVLELLIQMGKKYKIVIVSGRKDSNKEETVKWLDKFDIKYDDLFMRKADDNKKDSIVKKEIYENFIKPKYNVWMVVDDRLQVCRMWRSLGLTCLQVASGDF